MQKQRWWFLEPTRGQWLSFLAAWSGWVLDAFDFTIFLLVMPEITRQFGATSTAAAWVVTATLFTRLIGGLVAGTLADRIGRKLPLVISILWFALCDGAVALAPSFGWVLALRAIFGFGMGAQWTSGATLAMENWPARSRGIASGVLQGSWAVGYFLAALVSRTVLPLWGWRALFVIAALPVVLVIPVLIWVPESETWKKVRAAEPKASLRDLSGEGIIGRIVWACLLWAFAFGVYYGISALYPTLLKTELRLDGDTVAKLLMLFNVGMMVGSIACGVAASRFGAMIALAVPVLLLLPVLPIYTGTATSLLAAAPGWLWLGCFLAGVLGAGISGVTPMLLTLLFPVRIRALSSGIIYHVGALLAAGTPPLVAWLAEHRGLGFGKSITFVSGASALLMVGTLLLRPRRAVPEDTMAAPSAPAGATAGVAEHRST